MLTDLQRLLDGKKTYLTVAAILAYQLLGHYLYGTPLDWNVIGTAFGMGFLRAGVAKGAAVILLPVVLLAGCAGTADLVNAMAKDPATVCVQINTIYGTARAARTNIVDGNVTCNGDGLTVKSNGGSVGVPITVVPQISVGPMTVAPGK